MVRGGRGGSKTGFKKRVKGDEDMDDSDEDYVVSDEHSDASEDSLEDVAGSASEDGLGELLNDEVLNEDDGVNDDDYEGVLVEEEEDEEDGEDEIVESEVKRGSSGQRKFGDKTSRKWNRVSSDAESDDNDDDEDYDANDDNDVDDEEFIPDEDDCLDDEEESMMKKRNRSEMYKKLSRCDMRKNTTESGRKRRKKLAAPKNLTEKKGRKFKRKRKKDSLEDEDKDDAYFVELNMVMGGRGRKPLGRSKRRYMVRSDSDFACSESSEFEHTMSEEGREQVREASEICRNPIINPPRSLPSSERCMKSRYLRSRRAAPFGKTEQSVELLQQRKSAGLKGKRKVEEVIKQICGICLSEEDNKKVRGTLDSCSHYFCFTCIMEWSKVESRCPLCKQRFKTISKPARSAAGVYLRDALIQVQERDQVYQPSEEEIRGYLDPYENVICTECHHGGDDGLMLLCDFCDSPTHTYCVGLGREVPEGDWYCEGCRPSALGSSSPHIQDPTLSDKRMGTNGGDVMDLNMAPSPLLFTGVGGLASQRFNGLINQAASLFSGAGATTVSGRRWIQHHIHQILIGQRARAVASRVDGISAVHMDPYQSTSCIDQSSQTPLHHSRNPEIRASLESVFRERLQESPPPSLRSRDSFLSRQNTLRRQGVQEPLVMPPINTFREISFDEIGGMNGTILTPEQLPQSASSRLSLGSEFAVSHHAVREESHFYRAKEQVRSMVRSHLKIISKDVLGHDDLKDIVRSSTHTILAACGLDHWKAEVQTGLLPPPPLGCMHSEIGAAGQMSLINGLCSSCFDAYVRDVVVCVVNTKSRLWLSLCL